MNDDDFFEKLRSDASGLRFEGAPGAHERIRAAVRARIDRPAGVAEILVAWFRPLAAGLAAAMLAAAAVGWLQQSVAGDLLAGADAAPISEDYYRVAE